MAAEFPKQARDLIDAWNSHDAERIAGLFTNDAVYEDVTLGVVNQGHEQLREFAAEAFKAFPDFHMDLASAAIAGERGVAEWTMSATHAGDFPGMPATGKHFSVRGTSVFELAGDKFRQNRDYWDFATVLRQLGLMPEPATA